MIRLRSPLETLGAALILGAVVGCVFLIQKLLHESATQGPVHLGVQLAAAMPNSNAPIENSSQSSAIPQLAQYAMTLQRPLFEKGRRPWKPTPPEPILAAPEVSAPKIEAPQELPADIRLIGVHISATHKRALIRQGSRANSSWFGIGTEFSGWKLKDIDANRVTFENGGKIKSLQLYVEK